MNLGAEFPPKWVRGRYHTPNRDNALRTLSGQALTYLVKFSVLRSGAYLKSNSFLTNKWEKNRIMWYQVG